MAVDQYGAKGAPEFLDSSKPDVAVNATEVAKFAALVGNRKVGTKAEREALSTAPGSQDRRWEGLEFLETDTGRRYLQLGGQMVPRPHRKVVQFGNTFVGAAYDGMSPLVEMFYHGAVQASGTGSGNAGFDLPEPFPNGIIGVDVTLVASVAAVVKAKWSGETAPASSLGRIELAFLLASGAPVGASTFHRISARVIGW